MVTNNKLLFKILHCYKLLHDMWLWCIVFAHWIDCTSCFVAGTHSSSYFRSEAWRKNHLGSAVQSQYGWMIIFNQIPRGHEKLRKGSSGQGKCGCRWPKTRACVNVGDCMEIGELELMSPQEKWGHSESLTMAAWATFIAFLLFWDKETWVFTKT